MSELAEVKQEIDGIKAEIHEVKETQRDIKENHLKHLSNLVSGLACEVNSLRSYITDSLKAQRWFIMALMVALGVVLSILHVFG